MAWRVPSFSLGLMGMGLLHISGVRAGLTCAQAPGVASPRAFATTQVWGGHFGLVHGRVSSRRNVYQHDTVRI